MHVGIADPQWRTKRPRHSRRMHNPQFYVSESPTEKKYLAQLRICPLISGKLCWQKMGLVGPGYKRYIHWMRCVRDPRCRESRQFFSPQRMNRNIKVEVVHCYCIGVAWVLRRGKSRVTRMFLQQLVQLTTKNHAWSYWSFVRESLSQRASETESVCMSWRYHGWE